MAKKSKNKKNKNSKKTDTGRKSSKKDSTDKDNKKTLKKTQETPKKDNSVLMTVIIAVLAIIIGIGFLINKYLIIAEVNGQKITQLQLINELKKTYGRAVLDQIIADTLIQHEAKKMEIIPTQEEIQAVENEYISETGSSISIDDLLAQHNMTRDDLKQSIKKQLIIEKLLADKIAVTEEEVNQFYEKNKDYYPEEMSEEDAKAQAKEDLKQQKLAQSYGTWMQQLKDSASIDYMIEF